MQCDVLLVLRPKAATLERTIDNFGVGPVLENMRKAAEEIERLRRINDHLLSILSGISRQTAEAVKANSTE